MSHSAWSLMASSLPTQDQPVNLAVSMLIIFGAAKLLAELFERMKQPGIVGEILAGILVGPSLLGWVSPGEFTTTLAELGVMFLLFRVGLEIDAADLMKVGRTAAAVGILGVGVPFLAGWGVFHLWGKPQMESLFVGTALTATSVGITAQVLSTKGLLHRTASKIILGAAVIDDILALLLLGVVSSLAEGHVKTLELILTSVFAAGFVVLVARLGRRTMNRVIPQLHSKLRVGEAQFSLAMVFLFGMAALSIKAGVAGIIGAFLAGMALSEALPPRIHDLSHGVTELLVPFFLANIGLHFSWGAFAHQSTFLLALLLVPIAVFSKILGCGLGASRFGRLIATRVGLGMIPRGEFCMVVAQIGLDLKVIPPDTFGIIVFMAVTVTLMTPPLLKIAFKGILPQPEEKTEIFRLG
jgi:Na+:H+ antiporter